jgi:uncharacterized membrane protein
MYQIARKLLLVFIVSCWILSASAQAPPPLAPLTYTNIDIPSLPGSAVASINNAGEMVGVFSDTQGLFHGYFQDQNGQITTIDFPGAFETFVEGINDEGAMTGTWEDPVTAFQHGFILKNGNFVTVDVPGSTLNQPIGINDREEIAGLFGDADFNLRGFLFANGQFTTFNRGDGTLTFAVGVNDRGEVAGGFLDSGISHGFSVFHGVVSLIDVPGQTGTTPEGLNATGDIVGAYTDASFVQHGFVFSKGAFLTVDFPDATSTFPLNINAAGTIVGVYLDNAGNLHNFLAQPGPGNGENASPQTVSGQTPPANLDCSSAEWRKNPLHIRNFGGCRISH